MGSPCRYFSRLHLHFSHRKASIEFDALITQSSRLRDDGGQLGSCLLLNVGMDTGFFGGLDPSCNNSCPPASFRVLALGCKGARVLHCLGRCRRFTLRYERACEAAPTQNFVIECFSLLKDLQDRPYRGFLLDGRTRLLQGQIRQPELSFGDGELVAGRGPYGQCLLVPLSSARKIGLLDQQVSQPPHGIGRHILIAVFLPDREGLLESLLGAPQVPLQLMNICNVVAYEGGISSIRWVPSLQCLLIKLERASQITPVHSVVGKISHRRSHVSLVVEASKLGHGLAQHFLGSGRISL